MATQREAVVRALLERHGQTYADELGIDLRRNTPAPLFRLLCAALVLTAGIDHATALRAAKALRSIRTPQRMSEASKDEVIRIINRARVQRSVQMAGQLRKAARQLVDRYEGDLRRLRDEADGDVSTAKALLQEVTGIGDVAADLFLREVQVAWTEYAPYADARARRAARRLRLPSDPEQLADHAPDGKLPQLVAALVRVDLDDAYAEVRAAAREAEREARG